MTEAQVAAYSHYRLCFRADVIEPLRSVDRFRISTAVGVFEMSKRDFLTVFSNVTESGSYRLKGFYHYPRVPKKAEPFLVRVQSHAHVATAIHRKYALPSCLTGLCPETKYLRWLQRKAMAHVRRDRARGNSNAKCAEYKFAIHGAVQESQGKDAYTGKPLDWELISEYDNAASKGMGRIYKKRFANLPTVDHVGDGQGSPDFKICAWKVNDAKSDLTLEEFLALCRNVLQHCGKETRWQTKW